MMLARWGDKDHENKKTYKEGTANNNHCTLSKLFHKLSTNKKNPRILPGRTFKSYHTIQKIATIPQVTQHSRTLRYVSISGICPPDPLPDRSSISGICPPDPLPDRSSISGICPPDPLPDRKEPGKRALHTYFWPLFFSNC